MELGNFIFGNSRGEYPFLDRNIVDSKEWKNLCKKAQVDFYGWAEVERDVDGFDNDVFTIRPYYWGECTCGFDEKDWEWNKTHHHKKDCYQKLVEQELIQKGWQLNEIGYLSKPDNLSWDKATEIEDKIREKYCKQFGLSFPWGSAVHCTCGLNNEYEIWRQTNDHSEDCPIVLPNFLYKPTGFCIDWYKYPFRDAYMNQNLTKEEILNIFVECAKSI